MKLTYGLLAVYLLATALPLSRGLAHAQAVATPAGFSIATATQPELAAELIRRWEITKLPDFLEEKKGVIDEVQEGIEAMEAPLLRDILAADEASATQLNSSLIDPRVYSSLQHQTSSKYLLENIRKGELTPRASEKHWSRFGAYLELHLKGSPKEFAWGDTELFFDYKLLDRTDYHVNNAWEYGNYNPDSASPAVSMGRTNYFFAKRLRRLHEQNEIVFHNPVPLSALTKIVVVKGLRDKLLADIHAAKLPCPVSIGWEALIEEKALLKDSFKGTKQMAPVSE